MTRYFERYTAGVEPMVEIFDLETVATGRYVMLVDGPPTQYHRMAGSVLRSVIYPGWDEPTVPLEHHRQRQVGVPAQIDSPVKRHPANGTHRAILAPHWWDPPPPADDATVVTWKTWYVDEAGQIEKIIQSTCDAEGYMIREDYRGPDGELRDYSIFRYDHQGFLIDRVTHAPDGMVLNTEDA